MQVKSARRKSFSVTLKEFIAYKEGDMYTDMYTQANAAFQCMSCVYFCFFFSIKVDYACLPVSAVFLHAVNCEYRNALESALRVLIVRCARIRRDGDVAYQVNETAFTFCFVSFYKCSL